MKIARKVNTSNQMLSLSNDAYKYKSAPQDSLTMRLADRTVAASTYLTLSDAVSIKGEASWIVGNSIKVPRAGRYLIQLDYVHNGGAVSSPIQIFINGDSDYRVLTPNATDYTTGSVVLDLNANDILTFRTGTPAAINLSHRPALSIVCLEKQIPDVYAEKFAIGEPDLDNKVLIASVTNNADINFTLTEASYLLVRGQGSQPSSGGSIAFDLYKDVKDVDHFVYSSMAYLLRFGNVIPLYLPAGNYIFSTNAVSDITRILYRVPSKKISVVRPQVIAVPGKIDFIAETQIGYFETSAGVFKPKYQRAVLNVAIPAISAGNWGNSTTAWTADNVIIKPSTWYGTSDGAGWAVATRANGGFLSFFLHSTWSATTIPRVTVEYIKTSDPTYTLDQIQAMEPQA